MLDDGAISKAKQAQLDRELRTVDSVIREMAEMALAPEEGILFVMTNSVDVQRVATLQQMSKHIENDVPATKPQRARLCLHLLVNIVSYAPAVQIACAAGLSDMLPSLEADIIETVYSHAKRVAFQVDSSAFSAWCSLLFLAIKHLPAEALRGDVFDFLARVTDCGASERERRFGCRLIAAITSTDASLAWRLLPYVQRLAGDPLPSVRRSMAECLWTVLEALPHVSVREECTVTPLATLLLDTSMEVSTTTFKAMVHLLTVMDEAFVETFLFPVLLKYIVNAPPAAQDVVYSSFGRVVYYSRKCFARADFEHVFSVYSKMCRNSSEQCRKHCASNFLAMCATFNQQPALLPKVLGLLTSFVTDSSVAVRRSVAAGYHELFGLVLTNVPPNGEGALALGLSSGDLTGIGGVGLGGGGSSANNLAAMASSALMSASGAVNLALLAAADAADADAVTLISQIKMLQSNALLLMDDNDLVVRERLFNHVGVYLRSFSEMYKGDVAERRRVLDTVIPPLIKFEQAITTNWRKLSQLLKYFDTFPKYFSFDRLERDLVPMLVGHLVNGAVALKRKIAVTIATFLHTCGTREEAERTSRAIHTLVRSLLHSSSSQHRIAYVILVEGMTAVFSAPFVSMYLYLPLCKLRDDAVPSVRSHLASLLPALLAIPPLRAKAEQDIAAVLMRDSDSVVAAKARRARTEAARRDSSSAGGNGGGYGQSSTDGGGGGEGAEEHTYTYDAARDKLLAQQEAILLSRDVFKAGLEEAQTGGGSSGASFGAATPPTTSVSPTHASMAPDELNMRPRRRSRSPGRR